MFIVNMRLHAELNDFLPQGKREKVLAVTYTELPSVKHAIEALGAPHVEIDAIQANDRWVDFHYQLVDGDQIQVYPRSSRALLKNNPILLVPSPPQIIFALDSHLGQLATNLRILGFDALYRNDFEDTELAAIAQESQRILLTRDRRLLMRSVVKLGYCLRSLDPTQQVQEVVRHFELIAYIHPFQRCLRCNHPLEPVAKEAVLHRLLPLTRQYFNEFRRCPACDQIYWKGSHYDHMNKLIQQIREIDPSGEINIG